MKTPKAAEFPKLLENHGITRVDEFYWMNDRDHPDLIPYLNAENTYYQHHMRDCEELVDKLYAEIRSRIKEDDESLPVFKNGYWYISKTKKDLQYPIFTRRKGTLEAEEELLFDVNQMAEGHTYYQFASYKINEANSIAAFCVDTVSRREYLLRFKDLRTGALLKDQIEKTTGSCCWSNDNKAVYYTRKDPVTLRAYRIYKHIIGTDSEQDQLVYEESDTEYTVG
ncbi:MAG: oligopeptidase B, partial [Flavobacteriaceae bacterium]